MLFEIGFQYRRPVAARDRRCDLMLFEIGFQWPPSCRRRTCGCDLMLFEIGFQLSKLIGRFDKLL